MKTIYLFAFIILALPGFGQTVSIDDYNISPGSTLMVSVDVNNISNLGALTLFVGYDSTVLQYDTTMNFNLAIVGALANNIVSQSQVGIAWSAQSAGINLNSTAICDIKFTYLGGECDITLNSGCELADFGANVINTSFESGSVSEAFVASINNLNPDYCTNHQDIILEGTPLGGIFTINGIINSLLSPLSLGDGNYEVKYIYTNNYGISDTAIQSVGVHAEPLFTINSSDISCFGLNDGSAQINASSGNPPYNYSWSNSANTAANENLTAGVYSYTLSDTYCTVSGIIEILEANEIFSDIAITHASSITTADGAIDITISGGNGALSVLWSNSSSSEDLNNLPDGYYYLTVSDASQCELLDTAWVRAMSSQEVIRPHQWSIFSLNVDPYYPLLDSVLAPINANVSIAKDENGEVYWPSFNFNNIGDVEIGEAYQIKLFTADTFIVNGYYLYPEQHPIPLALGWSLFGVTRLSATPVIPTFAPIIANISLVKNSMGQVYWPQYSLDLIETLNPGEGYQMKTSSSTTLNYPAN